MFAVNNGSPKVRKCFFFFLTSLYIFNDPACNPNNFLLDDYLVLVIYGFAIV